MNNKTTIIKNAPKFSIDSFTAIYTAAMKKIIMNKTIKTKPTIFAASIFLKSS